MYGFIFIFDKSRSFLTRQHRRCAKQLPNTKWMKARISFFASWDAINSMHTYGIRHTPKNCGLICYQLSLKRLTIIESIGFGNVQIYLLHPTRYTLVYVLRGPHTTYTNQTIQFIDLHKLTIEQQPKMYYTSTHAGKLYYARIKGARWWWWWSGREERKKIGDFRCTILSKTSVAHRLPVKFKWNTQNRRPFWQFSMRR